MSVELALRPNASHLATATSTTIPNAVSQAQLEEMMAQRAGRTAATTIPNAVSEAELAAIMAERAGRTAHVGTALNVAALPTMVLPQSGAAALQKGVVQNAIVKTTLGTGTQLQTGFAQQIFKQGNKEAIKAAYDAAFAEGGKEAGKKAATEFIQKGAAELVSNPEAAKAIIKETTTGAVTSNVAKFAGPVVSGAIALGGAAYAQHKANEQLIGIYADDLRNVLGVDLKHAKVDDLKRLVATDPGKYDALKQELEKEYLISAGVGAGGGLAAGTAGTMAGAAAGGAIATGVALATGGTGAAFAPFIIKASSFVGGVAGSIVGSSSTQNFYKNITGQDKETCIDALRKLDAKVQNGEPVHALDVVKVIVGNDKKFDEAVKAVSKSGKKLEDLPVDEQVSVIMEQFPELHHSTTFLANEINQGKITDLTAITRLNTQAVNTYGVDYVEKAIGENNIVNFTRPLPKIEPQSAQVGTNMQGKETLGSGFRESLAQQNTAELANSR